MLRLRGIGICGAVMIAVVVFSVWEIHDTGWPLFFSSSSTA